MKACYTIHTQQVRHYEWRWHPTPRYIDKQIRTAMGLLPISFLVACLRVMLKQSWSE